MLKENLTKWRQVETCYFELIHANSNQQEDISEKIKNIGNEFDKSLEDDLNTHLALSAFFQLVKETNRLAASEKLGIENAKIIMNEFERISNILGLKIPQMNQEERNKIDNLILGREKFRQEKQFEKADEIRDKLNEMNIELIDHKGKTIWMKKEKIKKRFLKTNHQYSSSLSNQVTNLYGKLLIKNDIHNLDILFLSAFITLMKMSMRQSII